MKKVLLTFAMAAGCTVSAMAQDLPTYFPFPTSYAVWTERAATGGKAKVNIYGLRDESANVDGVVYHVLYQSPDVAISAAAVAIGGIRESGKRIYFYDYATKKERLLYDFSLVTGSEFYFEGAATATRVDHEETITINGEKRRMLVFEGDKAAWIEGIGNAHTGGLLGSALQRDNSCDCNTETLCFSLAATDKWNYHNNDWAALDCAGYGLSIPETAAGKTGIALYPNPVTGNSAIHMAGTQAAQVTIYSMTGGLVKTYQVVNGEDVNIRSNEFANGLYSYRVRTTSGETLQKGLFEVRN